MGRGRAGIDNPSIASGFVQNVLGLIAPRLPLEVPLHLAEFVWLSEHPPFVFISEGKPPKMVILKRRLPRGKAQRKEGSAFCFCSRFVFRFINRRGSIIVYQSL